MTFTLPSRRQRRRSGRSRSFGRHRGAADGQGRRVNRAVDPIRAPPANSISITPRGPARPLSLYRMRSVPAQNPVLFEESIARTPHARDA